MSPRNLESPKLPMNSPSSNNGGVSSAVPLLVDGQKIKKNHPKSVSITLFFRRGGRGELLSWIIVTVVALCSICMMSSRSFHFHVHVYENNNNNSHHNHNTKEGSSYESEGISTIQSNRMEQQAIPSWTSNSKSMSKSTSTTSATTTTTGRTIVRRTYRRARMLMGIFTADMKGEARYRDAFRALLSTHPKVCRLVDYMALDSVRGGPCELIYTFVVGGNPEGPTEIVQSKANQTILAQSVPKPAYSPDFERHPEDFSFLNIKENMNDGKSQTWFYYASTVMEKYDIEYAMKMDTDSMIYLDRYFDFADHSLPPSPYNTRILAGAPVDKEWWQASDSSKMEKEPYFRAQYSTMHLYAAGQMYILSKDLAEGVAFVAANAPEVRTYLEGHEDHDISMMAFLALQYEIDNPIKYIVIPYNNPFWKHNLKLKFGIAYWKQTWDTETDHMRNKYNKTKAVTIINNMNNRTTTEQTTIPQITREMREEWLDRIGKFDLTELRNYLVQHKLDIVQTNNLIASPESCFLQTGHLKNPIVMVEFHADGGKHWSAFAALIKEQIGSPDIVILNDMDVGMDRSGNVHTVELLAKELGMNFAWNVETVQLNDIDRNTHGLSGQAVLSTCKLFDPFVIRDKPNEKSIVEEKKLGAPSGLLVRTGTDDAIAGTANHLVIGSVHEIDPWSHKYAAYDYQFGHTAFNYMSGSVPHNQIGSVIAGEVGRELCNDIGLVNLDRVHVRARKTYPASCEGNGSTGTHRLEHICGNLVHYKGQMENVYLPCFRNSTNENDSVNMLLSTHSISSITLH